MSRQDRRSDEPSLFDLPLDAAGEGEERAAAPRRSARTERGATAEPAPEALPLFPAADPRSRAGEAARTSAIDPSRGAARDERLLRAVPLPGDTPAAPRVGIGRRLVAGVGDLALHGGIFVLMLAGARLLGSEITPSALLPTALGLLLFSLLYTVLPLAFWGQTPGMSFAGIVSSSIDGEPLSFGQSFRLWLASLLAVLFAGLPTVIAPRGRSLSDRLAGARTLPAAR